MKISRIAVHHVELPVPRGSYRISQGRDYAAFTSSVVVVQTDRGLVGVGESCPFGAAYAAAFLGGIAPAIAEIAPFLIGQDPRDIAAIGATMDQTLVGHSYAKSPIDIACWDILGKGAGLPIHRLIGGRLCSAYKPRMGLPVTEPVDVIRYMDELRSAGFSIFNAKAGDDPEKDVVRIRAIAERLRPDELVVVDANGGWRVDEATFAITALSDYPKLYFEQPCATYSECALVQKRTGCRLVLDESFNDLRSLLRGHADGVVDAVTLKVNKLGGLSKSRVVRDVCVELGIPMFIQDSWGSQITDATLAQLCHSMPPRFLLGAWCSWGHVSRSTVKNPASVIAGRVSAGDGPGLGITIDDDVLGVPVTVHTECCPAAEAAE